MSTPETRNRFPQGPVLPGPLNVLAEEPSLRTRDARPTFEELRKKITEGASINEVIGSVLTADARTLRTLFVSQRDLSSPRGNATVPIHEDMVTLYSPPDQEKLPVIVTEDLVRGFYFVTGLYSMVVDASEFNAKIPPAAVNATLDSSPHLREPAFQALVNELKINPNGVAWLTERAKEEFDDSHGELAGALRAVHGAGKLYEELDTRPDDRARIPRPDS